MYTSCMSITNAIELTQDNLKEDIEVKKRSQLSAYSIKLFLNDLYFTYRFERK